MYNPMPGFLLHDEYNDMRETVKTVKTLVFKDGKIIEKIEHLDIPFSAPESCFEHDVTKDFITGQCGKGTAK